MCITWKIKCWKFQGNFLHNQLHNYFKIPFKSLIYKSELTNGFIFDKQPFKLLALQLAWVLKNIFLHQPNIFSIIYKCTPQCCHFLRAPCCLSAICEFRQPHLTRRKVADFPLTLYVAGSAQSVQLIRYRLYDRTVFFRVPAEARPFSKRPGMYSDLSTRYQMDAGTLLPGVKLPRREAGCLPPSRTGIKNKLNYTPTPPCAFVECTGITLLFQLIPEDIRTIILPVVLYVCETWWLTLREDRRLCVFENRVLRRIFGPKRDELTEEWKILHNEELNDLCSSPSIVRVLKSRRMRWAGHVARMQASRGAYMVLVGNLRERVHLRYPGLDERIILNGSSGSGVWGYGLDRTGSG